LVLVELARPHSRKRLEVVVQILYLVLLLLPAVAVAALDITGALGIME
jgi:hypothetical protein